MARLRERAGDQGLARVELVAERLLDEGPTCVWVVTTPSFRISDSSASPISAAVW